MFSRLWGPSVAIVLAAAVVPLQIAERPFERSYVYKGFKVRVAEGVGEARSIGTYTITLTPPDGKPAVIKSRRDGTIQDAWVTNLNIEGNLAVVIVTQSAGSGSFGALAIYRWMGTSLESLRVADLSLPQKQGYRGHDVFRLDRGSVERVFPVYRANDPNTSPSGGTRRLVYDFKNNRWISDWRGG